MESELQTLEDRIRQAAALARRLRDENVDLRQRIAALESEKKRLAEKVETTAERLESLIRQIPE